MTDQKKPRVTLRDIARIAEVSVASVSLALRDSPRISKEKKIGIAKICDQLGYVRDGRLSQLMSHLRSLDCKDRGASLAAVITHPSPNDSDYKATKLALLASIKAEAAKQGYSLDVVELVREGISPKRLEQILSARGITGVIVLPSDDHSALDGFDYSKFHVVGIGYELDDPAPHRVCANYIKMMDELMRHALKLGYRRLGLIPEQSQALLKNRMLGSSIDYYLSTVPEAERVDVFCGDFDSDRAIRFWLSEQRPDLVLGSRKAYDRLTAMGCSFPQDFGFASWDLQDMPEEVAGLDLRPGLLGAEAVRQVVDGVNRNELGLPASPGITVVDSRFCPGQSLAEANGRSSLEAAEQTSAIA